MASVYGVNFGQRAQSAATMGWQNYCGEGEPDDGMIPMLPPVKGADRKNFLCSLSTRCCKKTKVCASLAGEQERPLECFGRIASQTRQRCASKPGVE